MRRSLLPMTSLLALAGACGSAVDGRAGLDADEPPPQTWATATTTLLAVGPSTTIRGKADAGTDVLVGGFIVSCGVSLEYGPVAGVADDTGVFEVALPVDDAADLDLVAAFVDVDDDGEFDAAVDVVLSAGGYGGVSGGGDGVVTLGVTPEGDWVRDVIPPVLLAATTTEQ